jgi:adenine deaminase
MVLAANRLVELGGGYVIASRGEVIFEFALPIAGLMSERPFEEVAEKTRQLEEILLGELGCTFPTRPIMGLNFLCLPNIPKFGFTDKGLISTSELALVDTLVQVDG